MAFLGVSASLRETMFLRFKKSCRVWSFGLRQSSFIRISGFLILSGILAIQTSCGSSRSALTLHPANNGRPYNAVFTRAFWSPDQAGEDQVVLLNDPIDQTSDGDAGDPLQPQTVPPIRHLLVMHLQWHTAPTRIDTPASTNAVLNWYVFGGGFAGAVHYTGSADVSISPHGTGATVEIRRGRLNLTDKTGPLQDPLGSFAVDGTFEAINNPAQFQQALKALKAAKAEADRANQPATSEPAIRNTSDSLPQPGRY